jgi:hypothetical protein
MVSVPESFERLLSNFVVCCCVHEQHAKQHDMPSHTSWLGVVDLNCCNGSNLCSLDVEEVDIMGKNVDHSEDEHCVGTLSVEPHGLIERKKLELGSDEPHQVSAHG